MTGGELVELEPVGIAGHRPSGLGGADHPMRTMTRRAAGLDGPPWDAAARAEVAAFFDGLAPEWHTRSSPERTAVVLDALERGGVGGGVALEVGSGIGAYSAVLADRFATVVSLEVAFEMLRRAPASASARVLADAAAVPVPDRSVDAVVLVNAFLFPAEVDRILRPGGRVVWVCSSGEQTPIYLSAADVVRALPGSWRGVAARAGAGTWCVLERAG